MLRKENTTIHVLVPLKRLHGLLESVKESFSLHPSISPPIVLRAYIQRATHWAEAGMDLTPWNLQATGHRRSPNDRTDEGYIVNWDKGRTQFYRET